MPSKLKRRNGKGLSFAPVSLAFARPMLRASIDGSTGGHATIGRCASKGCRLMLKSRIEAR